MNSKISTDQDLEEKIKKCEEALRYLTNEQLVKLFKYLLDEEKWHKTLHL